MNKFEQHDIWNTVASLRSELSDVHPDAEDEDARDTLEYVLVLVETLETYRTTANPLLLPAARLTATQAQLSALVQAVLTWKADDLEGPSAVDSVVVAVVDTMASWPALRPDQEAAAVNAAINGLSDSVDAAMQQLGDRQRELAEQLDDLGAAQLGLEKSTAELGEANKKILYDLSASWEEDQRQRNEEGRAAIGALEDLRDDARRMVQDSTSLMVGTEYAEQAKERRKSARLYDVLAVAFGTIGVVTLLIYVLEGKTEEATLGFAVTRLGLALGAFVIGGFLASRGQDQHKEARELQRTALVLSRMAPFVANLDPLAQEVLTIETADRIFTRGELGEVTEREGVLSKLRAERERRKAEEETEEDAV